MPVALPSLNPNDPYDPRFQASLLSSLLQKAWKEHTAALLPPERTRSVADVIRAKLISLYPQSDMEMLRRYGAAEERHVVGVWVFASENGNAPGQTRKDVRVQFEDTILLPRSHHDIMSGGPRFSLDPTCGCKPEHWNSLSKEEQDAILLDRSKRDLHQLPEETESYFTDVFQARQEYRRETEESGSWLEAFHRTHGRLATWREIADTFPVLGKFLAANCFPAAKGKAA